MITGGMSRIKIRGQRILKDFFEKHGNCLGEQEWVDRGVESFIPVFTQPDTVMIIPCAGVSMADIIDNVSDVLAEDGFNIDEVDFQITK